MPVLLVRHAHAGKRSEWPGDDRLRPLSARGRQQAQGLASLVEGRAPQRILSSPYTRCLQSVAPLAADLGIPVETSEILAEGTEGEAVDLVRGLAHEKVLLCSHGDVISEVLVALADEDRLDLGPRPRQAKGSVWVLEASGERFVRATYLSPVASPQVS
ncbi:MAG: SixA phosphatase family protein [Acidimicrobiales bacterium]